jgi:hypothetical protein
LPNPFLRINPLGGSVSIDEAALGGQAREMLERHPPYARQLRLAVPARIGADDRELLVLAEGGATLSQLASLHDLPIAGLRALAGGLARKALARVAPMPREYHELHRFHCNQRPLFDPEPGRALAEWAGEGPGLAGGHLLGGDANRAEAVAVVSALLGYFGSLRLAADEPVAIRAAHPDRLWPLLACLVLGAKPCFGMQAQARIAIVDGPVDSAAAHALCVGPGCGTDATTLAGVLSAWSDEAGDGLAGRGRASAGWSELIGVDAQGRLRLLPDAGQRDRRPPQGGAK